VHFNDIFQVLPCLINYHILICWWTTHYCSEFSLIADEIFVNFLQISREDAQAFARENRIHYMEVSAKNRYNVDEAFLKLVHIIRLTS